MRVIYSVLREINKGTSLPTARDYGLKQREFENFILHLEKEGYIERVLRMDTFFSLKPTRLTKKGHDFLEKYKHVEDDYPDKKDIIKWIQVEKEMYSNGAEEEDY
jgi:predicted transcriptional regulator